ncbi:hypothetical protein [Lysobacter gummosus]
MLDAVPDARRLALTAATPSPAFPSGDRNVLPRRHEHDPAAAAGP